MTMSDHILPKIWWCVVIVLSDLVDSPAPVVASRMFQDDMASKYLVGWCVFVEPGNVATGQRRHFGRGRYCLTLDSHFRQCRMGLILKLTTAIQAKTWLVHIHTVNQCGLLWASTTALLWQHILRYFLSCINKQSNSYQLCYVMEEQCNFVVNLTQ